MKTLNHSYLSRLDHLRFFAAVLVILHHCRGSINYSGSISGLKDIADLWVRWGSTGVSLFLALSGFLFCIIANAGSKDIKYGAFIKNRILRIAPLATIFVFIAMCIDQKNSTPMDIFRLLTLQLNTGAPGTGWGYKIYPMGPIWTIAVEFQFYLLFPFLAIFLHRNGIKSLVGIIVAFILIKASIVIFNGEWVYYRLYHSLVGRIDQFLVGMIAGYFYVKGYLKSSLIAAPAMIIVALTGMTIFLHFNSKMNTFFMPFSFTVEAILWSLLIYGYVSMGIIINRTLDSALAYLGGLSFSMYLIHLVVYKALTMTLLPKATSNFDFLINAIAFIIPVTTIVSIITYTFIEKPFLGLRVKYAEQNK